MRGHLGFISCQKRLRLSCKVDECKPVPGSRGCAAGVESSGTMRQGLTLVHFSAQLKRILWDRGAFRG